MIFDRFGNELVTEAVFGIFLYQSTKAVYILFSSGETKWIPKSMIDNLEDLEVSDHENLQYLEIASFLTVIHNLPIEY